MMFILVIILSGIWGAVCSYIFPFPLFLIPCAIGGAIIGFVFGWINQRIK